MPEQFKLAFRIMKDIPTEFVGIDLKNYGPFKAGEVVEMPFEVANILISKKFAIVDKLWLKQKMKEMGEDNFLDWLKTNYEKSEVINKVQFEEICPPAFFKNLERLEKMEAKKEKAIKELWKKGEIDKEEFEQKFEDISEYLETNGFIKIEKRVKLTSTAKEEALKKIPILKDFAFEEVSKERFDFFGYTYKFDENNFFELVYLKPYETYIFVDWKNKKVFEVFEVMPKGKNYVKIKPKWIADMTNTLKNFTIIDDFVLSIDYEKLFDTILDYFKSQVYLLNEEEYLIETAYTILTWIPEILNVAPFLRLYAPKGSGKTTNLEAINRIAFRCILSVSPTFASLPRLAHYHNAFLPIDEARIKSDNLETEENIFDILRARNRRGMFYVKADPNNPFGVLNLEVFGLTAIAGKKPIPDDIEDRCYRIEIQKKIGFKPKKVSKKEIEEIVLGLSKLRLWIILNNKIEELQKLLEKTFDILIDAGFESRFVEIVAPALMLIPKKYHERIVSFIREKQIWRFEEDKTTEEAYVFEAIFQLLKEKLQNFDLKNFNKETEISVLDITQRYLLIENPQGDFDSLPERDRKSALIRVGFLIRRLGLKTRRKEEGVFVIISPRIVKELASRYSIEKIQIEDKIELPSISEWWL